MSPPTKSGYAGAPQLSIPANLFGVPAGTAGSFQLENRPVEAMEAFSSGVAVNFTATAGGLSASRPQSEPYAFTRPLGSTSLLTLQRIFDLRPLASVEFVAGQTTNVPAASAASPTTSRTPTSPSGRSRPSSATTNSGSNSCRCRTPRRPHPARASARPSVTTIGSREPAEPAHLASLGRCPRETPSPTLPTGSGRSWSARPQRSRRGTARCVAGAPALRSHRRADRHLRQAPLPAIRG